MADAPDWPVARGDDAKSKGSGSRQKISLIEGHDGSGTTVGRRLQHHLIVGIAKLWPPHEVEWSLVTVRGKKIQDHVDVLGRKSRLTNEGRPLEHVFILQKERH